MATLRCCVGVASTGTSIGTSFESTSANNATSSSYSRCKQQQQSRLLPYTCGTTGRGAVSLSKTREHPVPVSFGSSTYSFGVLSEVAVQCGKRHGKKHICAASAADSSSAFPEPSSSSSDTSSPSSSPADFSTIPPVEILKDEGPKSFWQNWQRKSAALRERVSKWGLAAVLAYGIFDGLTYTTFFVLAFLSYEKSTGQNPATNLKALLGVVVLMWGANNVTRPFRVAGAAALAPLIDRGLKKMQEVLKLPNQAFAFMICVAVLAGACLSTMGLLILSRLVI